MKYHCETGIANEMAERTKRVCYNREGERKLKGSEDTLREPEKKIIYIK